MTNSTIGDLLLSQNGQSDKNIHLLIKLRI